MNPHPCSTLALVLFAATALAGAPAAAADPFADRLVFDNGDVLHGGLRSFSKAQGLGFAHKNSTTPIQFGSANLDCVELNGSTPVLDGVGKQGDWIVCDNGGGGAKFAAAALALHQAAIGRKVDFPPRFKLDMTLTREGQAEDCQVYLRAKHADENNWGCDGLKIEIHADSAGIILHLSSERSNEGNWSGRPLQLAGGEKKVALSFGVDLPGRRVVVFKNGEVAGVMALGAMVVDGDYLLLGSDGDISLSGLKVSAWDGRRFSPLPALAADGIGFANGDQASGQLLSIRDGKASFKTEFASMEVPLARISHVVLAHPAAVAPKSEAGAVRLYFNALDRMTLQLEAIQAGKLSGSHPALGECVCELGAWRKLRFNGDGLFRLTGKWGCQREEDELMPIELLPDGQAIGRKVDNNGDGQDVRLAGWARADGTHLTLQEESQDDDGKKISGKHRYEFKLTEDGGLELKALDGGQFGGMFVRP